MKVSRFIGATVGAVVLSIGLSGVVAADTVVGQTGNYIITDGPTTPGAACHYSSTAPNHIDKITVRKPQVWWPDTSANSNTQHGPVGWQVRILHKSASATTWKLLKKSTLHVAIAHEDNPPYDPNDDASFSKIVLNIAGSNYAATHEFRVRIRLFWFSKMDGSVMGTVTHDVLYYRFGPGSTDIRSGDCHAAV